MWISTSGANPSVEKTSADEASADETSVVERESTTFSKPILLTVLEITTVYNMEKNW